jgi:hypothetical protein
MKDLLEKVEDFTDKLKPRHDDDFVDRLHYVVMPTILTALAAFIGGKQFFGEPIQCWAPNEIARHHHWMEYAENLCFAEVGKKWGGRVVLVSFDLCLNLKGQNFGN